MTLRESLRRLWGTFRPGRADRDLEAELRLHLELAADEAQRRGEPADRARRDARLQAGGVIQAVEAMRDQRGLPWLEDLVRDLRHGCRMLARNPGFTAVCVLSLAIGIGANCAVFSFADGFLLRPLPVPDAGGVMTVGSTTSSGRSISASYRDYIDIRDRSRSFDGLVAFTGSAVPFAVDTRTLPKARIGLLVSGNFFPVMGVEPQLGRGFRAEENVVPGRDAVVILGHALWTEQFGADRAVLGRTVRINGIEFVVIGVAPAGFTGLDQYTRFEFYAPLMMWPRLAGDPGGRLLEARDARVLTMKGRLKPGVDVAQAQTELTAIAADLERAYPDTNRNRRLAVRSELRTRIEQAPPLAMLILMLAVLAGAVLFVACANVAGLLSSRAPMRAREIALRLAIGAGRLRVVRQLVTESVLVALLGGFLGLGVGYAGVTLFRQFRIPTELPIAASFALDRRALLVSLVVALASAVLFGLAPAIRATRADLIAVMKATDAAGFGRRQRGRAVLVAGQVAVSVVLLVVATFVYRAFQQRLDSGPGFRTDHVLLMWFQPDRARYSETQAQQFFEQVAARARLVPGVATAALASYVPLDGGVDRAAIAPEGFQFPAGVENAAVPAAAIDDQYFETLQVPIVQGRAFRRSDTADAPKVAIVNEPLARRYWPGQNALGKRFRLNDSRGPWVEIVGVAKTGKYIQLAEPPVDFVYFPYLQCPSPLMALMVESIGDPASMAAPMRDAVRGLDPEQSIYNMRTLEENYRMRQLVIVDVVIRLIGAMGIMGLALAIVGLYGLVSYAASRRTKEIGIRMAIGAGQRDVLRMVLRQGAVLALAGLGVGLLASAVAGRGLAAVFPSGSGDGGADLVAFLLVAATVLTVTLLAAYVPARRASRINPTDALRHE